jgi:hypothetical protein
MPRPHRTSCCTGGSTELSAANIHAVARARPFVSRGISASDCSAMWRTIAPDSKSASSGVSIAGTCPNGCSAR